MFRWETRPVTYHPRLIFTAVPLHYERQTCAVDYKECLKDIKKGDFVYLDPPYASRRRNRYGEYGYDCFSEEDLPSLYCTLDMIDNVVQNFYCRIVSIIPLLHFHAVGILQLSEFGGTSPGLLIIDERCGKCLFPTLLTQRCSF
ncbi:MAG: DNA adenine methylase [Pirellulales bacterium]